MWVFTNIGFISAVAHRTKRDHLMVRARRLEHLQAIFPGIEVHQTNNADYKYRVVIHRDLLAAVINKEIDGMQYDNFKNSISDHAYHDACSQVWRVMHALQPGSYMPPLPDLFEEAPPEGDKACPGCGIAGHFKTEYSGADERAVVVCTFCGESWEIPPPEIAGDAYSFGDPDKYQDDDHLPSGMN